MLVSSVRPGQSNSAKNLELLCCDKPEVLRRFRRMFSNGLTCNLPFSCMNVTRDSGSDELLPNKMSREPILLNVYDMYKINDYTSNIGLGVFHSGKTEASLFAFKLKRISSCRCGNIRHRVCIWWTPIPLHWNFRNKP